MKTKEEIMSMSASEYDQFMVNTFRNQFCERNRSMKETCMCWGFEIGKGWHYILYDLCCKLDYIEKTHGIGIQWSQIKEKYGSARFYHKFIYGNKAIYKNKWLSFLSLFGFKYKLISNEETRYVYDIIYALVEKAEEETNRTCEVSGEVYYHPKISFNGWIYAMSEESFLSEFPERKEELELKEKRRKLLEKAKDATYYISEDELNKLISRKEEIIKELIK